MKIKYETSGIESITVCPFFIKGKTVGTYGCTEDCEHFVDEKGNNSIECNYDKRCNDVL